MKPGTIKRRQRRLPSTSGESDVEEYATQRVASEADAAVASNPASYEPAKANKTAYAAIKSPGEGAGKNTITKFFRKEMIGAGLQPTWPPAPPPNTTQQASITRDVQVTLTHECATRHHRCYHPPHKEATALRATAQPGLLHRPHELRATRERDSPLLVRELPHAHVRSAAGDDDAR